MSDGKLMLKGIVYGGGTEINDNAVANDATWSSSKIDTAIKQAIYNVLPTRSASGTIASFTDGAEDMPIVDGVFGIVATQEGTGDPSPSNPRAISGFTGMSIYRTGINLWDEVWEVGGIDGSTGQDVPANDRIRSKNFIPVKGGMSYYCKTNSKTMGLRFYDYSKNYINYTTVIDGIVAIPSDVYFIRFIYLNTTTYANDISINYPATDTSYHAYTGTSFPVDWTDEAGTVYGGILDVTTGVLSITDIITDMGELTWTKYTSYTYTVFSSNLSSLDIVTGKSGDIDIKCDIYKPIGALTLGGSGGFGNNPHDLEVCQLTNGTQIMIQDANYTSAEDFTTAVDGHTLVIKLATPITYQLTPVEIKTLLGANNIWCDTGNSTVKFKADIGLLISEMEA